MAAQNAKRWILAIYILRKNRGLWTVEKNRNNQWLISQYLLEKTSSWRSWIFFLKASISFFISRLRLSIKYTNMRRAKTTEGKRSRKSSTVCLLVTYVDFSFLWLPVVIMAHIGSSQSERRKFGLDQSESRISPMWLIDVTTIVLAHVTPPEVTPQTPGSDRATGSDLATSPQSTGSDRATGSHYPVHRKWPRNRKSAPQLVPSLPEVSARPEVEKCTLLHNGITGLYICVGCCTLTLVVLFWGDFKQRMRVE